jgi:hypothetical protein
MGTSSSSRVSDTAAWRRARQAAQDDEGAVEAISEAIVSDDPQLQQPPSEQPSFPLEAILPPRRPSGLSDGAGGVSGGARPGSPVSPSNLAGKAGGARSRRAVLRSASRGGAALAAAHAYRQGNSGLLKETFQLDLDELQGMSAGERVGAIMSAVLGDGTEPLDGLLKSSLTEVLYRVAGDDVNDSPSSRDSVIAFISEYSAQLAMHELLSESQDEPLSHERVEQIEAEMREHIDNVAYRVDLPDDVVDEAQIRTQAENLMKEALAVGRAASE